MPQQRPPNDDREDPFTALRRAADESFNSLFSSLIGLPSTIYKQGNDHGREWARLSRSGREGPSSTSDGEPSEDHSHGGCPYLKNGGPRWEQAQAQKGDGNGDDGPEDLMAMIRAEIEKGEQKAHEVYQTWMRQTESPDRPVGFGEEVPPEEQAERRHCRRGGHWWRGRCRRQEKAKESESNTISAAPEDSTALQKDTPTGQCTRHEFGWPDDALPQVDPFKTLRQPVFDGEPFWFNSFDFGMADRRFWSHVDFLFNSSYSPLYLDTISDVDLTWKARYEDLLRTQAGKELMTEEERHALVSDFDYVRRMIGLMNEIQPHRQNPFSAADDPDGRMTEEDVYDRFLGDITRTLPEATSSQVESRDLAKPDVLSSLTTTQRHVAADGTITTKTVLRRRFADGREETEEKTETSRDPNWNPRKQVEEQQTMTPKPVPKSAVIEELKRKEQSQGKKGWFWSN